MINIFAYGTLMFPKLVYALTGKHFRSEDAHIENYIRYKVITPNSSEEHPAIIEKSSSIANGKVLYNIDDQSFNLLIFMKVMNINELQILFYFLIKHLLNPDYVLELCNEH